jgi:hypothetical protein
VRGGGFFRRVATSAVGLLSLGGLSPKPIVTSTSAVTARTPAGQSKAPTSQVSASQLQVRHIKGRTMYRSYLSSRVIPPFKFAHGRTMVARYPRRPGS